MHKMQLTEGYETVGENEDAVTADFSRVPSTKDKIVLHHYAPNRGASMRLRYGGKMPWVVRWQ